MAQIKKKFIGNDQVSDEKILLDNNDALRAKDGAGDPQDILKIDDQADNVVLLGPAAIIIQPTGGITQTGEGDQVQLRGESRLQFFDSGNDFSVELKAEGTLTESTSYTLPDTDGTSGQVLSTDGSGKLSFVDNGVASYGKETFTLITADITNQYLDLQEVVQANSVQMLVKGAGVMLEGAGEQFTVSLTGGAGGKTRILFQNELATLGASALEAGDVVQIMYIFV